MTTKTEEAIDPTKTTTEEVKATEPTPEQIEKEAQEADSALQAGFNEAHGNTSAEAPAKKAEEIASTEEKTDTKTGDDKSTSTAATDEAAAATAAAAEKAKTPEELAKVFAGKSAEQILAVFEKVPGLENRFNEELNKVNGELSKVYGKFGELTRHIQQLQGKSGARTFKAGSFKRLSEEFPEIAEMLAEGLSEAFGGEAPATTTTETKSGDGNKKTDNAADIDSRVTAAVASAVQEVTLRNGQQFLTVLHPTWRADCNTPEFKAFMQTLPEADRTKYVDSDDVFVAAECFTKFKDWKGKAGNGQDNGQGKNGNGQKGARKQERLEKAITPQGDGALQPTVLDDNAAFEAGFKSVADRGK